MRVVRIFLLVMMTLVLTQVFTGGPAYAAAVPQGFTMTVSNPYCYQSALETGMCYINVRSITASGGSGGFDYFDISINGKVRTRMQNFFETTANFFENMLGEGLKVSCGEPNAGGSPAFGNLYNVTVQAYASGASITSDSAFVYCPYYKKPYVPPPQSYRPYIPLLLLDDQ